MERPRNTEKIRAFATAIVNLGRIGAKYLFTNQFASHGDHFNHSEYIDPPTEEMDLDEIHDAMGDDLFNRRYQQPDLWQGLSYYEGDLAHLEELHDSLPPRKDI